MVRGTRELASRPARQDDRLFVTLAPVKAAQLLANMPDDAADDSRAQAEPPPICQPRPH